MERKKLVIIPTYNERENIGKLIEEIDKGYDILIVDDNSPDGTGEMLDQISKLNTRVSVMHRDNKLGLGSAYIKGFNYAINKNYDYIFTMDADFSHDPKYLNKFEEFVGKYDFVIGSRYIKGGGIYGWPIHRMILSNYGNKYARFVTGMNINDFTSGFNAIRVDVLRNIRLDKITSEGYGFLIELKHNTVKKGYRFVEVPIIFNDRTSGKSKISKGIIFEAILLAWKLRLKKYT